MKQFSFTKLIMAVLLMLNVAVVAYICWLMHSTGDLSPAPYLLIGEGGPLSVWLLVYAWKEKAANRSKYAMQYVDKTADTYGPETAIRIAEIVLQD